jgi:hypothetical protein
MISPNRFNDGAQTELPNTIQVVHTIKLSQGVEQLMQLLLTRLSAPPGPATEPVTSASWDAPPADPPPDTAAMQPESPPPPPPQSECLTMMAAYMKFIFPVRSQTISKKSANDHRGSMTAFDQWFSEQFLKDRGARCVTPRPSCFPAIQENADSILFEFSKWRLQREGNSVTTVNRRLGHLKMVCKEAVAHGLLTKVPAKPTIADLKRMRPKKESAKRTKSKAVAIADVGKLLNHTSAASYPQLGDVSPADFWDGCIRYHALWGPRTQDVFAYRDPAKDGLLWSDVYTSPECPDSELAEEIPGLQSPHGWLYYRIEKDKHSDEQFILLPLPLWLKQFIERFRGLDSQRVFPLSRNHKAWGASWRAIREAAGVGDHVFLSQGTGNTAAMRKTASRWWRKLSKQDVFADYLLHHGAVTTSRKHYLSAMEDVVPTLIERMDEFDFGTG